jgi:hypothetical protein
MPPFLLFRGLGLSCLSLVSPSSPWLISHGDYSASTPSVPFFRPLILSGSLIGCQSIQVYCHYLSFHIMTHHRTETIRENLFFCLGDGQLFQNVLTLVFLILSEDPTVCFTISSPTVCLKVLLSVLLLPIHNQYI